MIYISKNNHAEILTDNLLDYIPDKLKLYLDDIYLGEFDNLSSNKKYLRFIVPTSTLDPREYELFIYTNGLKMKSELVVIIDFTQQIQSSADEKKSIIFYEDFNS